MMATAPLTPAQAELISSLSQDEIPIKLRCAICSKLAVNAFRLPCCEQAICENCQSTLPSSCPVCEHTPVAAEDCKPNKSLRTTIKVFLRTEEKKREALRVKDQKHTPPDTPATPATPIDAVAVSNVSSEAAPTYRLEAKDDTFQSASGEAHTSGDENLPALAANPLGVGLPGEAQKDIPHPSIEEIIPGQEPIEEGNFTSAEIGDSNTEIVDGQPDQNGSAENTANGQPLGMMGMAQPIGFGMGYGFDGTGVTGFPNMALMGQGADFNQMQMMMAMQNGMAPNAFGTFPMMGMPGMTMDPMAMQNMYMNGGFGAQGMGMNGMNMGMGMAGYDGGVGTGFNNGWNGQQSWNIGQDNFNLPNAASMGHGDYGSSNSGFNASGYNQGNYGRSNQYNDYSQNGYGHQNQGNFFRGRGRGRGYGYGSNRGGHGYGQNDSFSQYQFQNGTAQGPTGSMSDRDSIPSGPKADMANAPPESNVDEFGREIRQPSEAKISDETTESRPSGEADNIAPEAEQVIPEKLAQGNENVLVETEQQEHDTPKPIQTLEQIESNASLIPQAPPSASLSIPLVPSGPSDRGQSIARGGFHNAYNDRNGSGSVQPTNVPAVAKVLDIPINAPTGPKAMREGLPNTSLVNLRGRGVFPMIGRGGMRPAVLHAETTMNSVRSRSNSPQKEINMEQDVDVNESRSASEDRDRERDRRSDKHRKRRHRSTSESEEEKDDERRSDRHRRRHRHRSNSPSDDEESRRERRRRRKYDEAPEAADRDPEPPGEERAVYDDDVKRSRSQSPTDSRRSSHRSRRDRERDREKDRDRDREYKSTSHKHRSSHRSHRDRSRSRDRDRDRDRDRARDYDRDRERDRERRHRHRRESLSPKDKEAESQPITAVETEKPEIKIPSGPRAMSISSSSTKPYMNGTNGIEIKGVSTRRQSVQDATTTTEDRTKTATSSNNTTTFSKTTSDDRKDRKDHTHARNRDRDSDRSRDTTTTTSRSAPAAQAPSHKPSHSTPTPSPLADPHTLEREARNRERLLKEAQRIAGLAAADRGGGGGGVGGRKRSRDEVAGTENNEGSRSAGGGGGGRSGARKYRRGTGAGLGDREGEEERIARGEGEREAGRWG